MLPAQLRNRKRSGVQQQCTLPTGVRQESLLACNSSADPCGSGPTGCGLWEGEKEFSPRFCHHYKPPQQPAVKNQPPLPALPPPPLLGAGRPAGRIGSQPSAHSL
ncbi:hypothetical protein NDU88_007308, partial [Pleurodeles waltl]